MKRLTAISAAIVLLSGASAASAADIYSNGVGGLKDGPAVRNSWTGFYVGGHGGYAWGQWNGPMFYENAYKYADPEKYPLLTFDGSDKKISADSWNGGFQLGVNYQHGPLVVGLEGDISIGNFKHDGSFLPYPDNASSPAWHITTDIDWLGTARVRTGYLVSPNVLTYVTGGLAFAQTTSSIEPVYTGRDPVSSTSADNNHIGWTIGGGAEWALTKHLSLKAEYLYIDLGKQDYDFHGVTNNVPSYDTDHYKPDLSLHAIRAGINYRF